MNGPCVWVHVCFVVICQEMRDAAANVLIDEGGSYAAEMRRGCAQSCLSLCDPMD